MKRNMTQWLQDLLAQPEKKAIPILSYPGAQLMGVGMRELLASSDLQVQCMKAVAERSPSAAAFAPMDLSVEAECFGSKIQFYDDDVPAVVGSIVTCMEDVEALRIPAPGEARTQTTIDTVAKAVEVITDRPVFAGMIGPYSLAGRLLDVTESIYMCYDEPEVVSALLEKLTEYLIGFGKALKATGANGIVLAEPLAGTLSPTLEEEFSAPYVKRIIDALQDDEFLIIYHNCGDSVLHMVPSILSTGAGAYHFGNAISMEEMLKKVPADVVVMGNVDPARQFCNGTPQSIAQETTAVMDACCKYPNFAISSGCDVPMQSSWENIDAFYAAVAAYGK